MKLRLLLKKAGVRRASVERDRVVLTFDSHSPVDVQRLVALIAEGNGKMELTPDQRLRFRLSGKGPRAMLEETGKILWQIL